MARTKISKVAKDLNVALPTVVDFLRSKNITVDDNPNARIEDDVVDILVKEFKSDKDQKTKSEQFSSERMQQRDIKKPAPKVGASEEIKLPTEINRPKIVGKIDLDRQSQKPQPLLLLQRRLPPLRFPLHLSRRRLLPRSLFPARRNTPPLRLRRSLPRRPGPRKCKK